jgi:hypothetical protein
MTSRPSRLFQALSFVSALLLWSGCGTTGYEMKVDAITRPKAVEANAPASYRIRNKNPTVEEDSLRYREAVDYIKTALSAKGLYEAPNNERADMIVELDYGMERPRVKMKEESVPIFAQVGGGVRYEQVSSVDTRGNTVTRTVAVFDPPRTELIGYEDVAVPVTIYEKYIKISARENKTPDEGRPPAEIWSVNVSSEDESKDLRKYLPLLASASADYIGKDSTTQKIVKIKPNDEVVGFVKKGM